MEEYYQIIGYSGSLLIGVSLMMKNIRHLRKVNLFGAATFATYGLLVGAYPVLILNSFITIVDIYYLVQMNRKKELFSLMPVLDNRHLFLNKFLDHYSKDIHRFFPSCSREEIDTAHCYFILRNLLPVGLFIYKELSPEKIEVLIDYAIPDYRDMKNARFIYDAESDFLKEKGYKEISAVSTVPKHRRYLLNVGFLKDNKMHDKFIRRIGI